MTVRRKWLVALAALAAAIGLAIAVGCSQREGAEGAPAIDTDLMAFLSEARALHHQANLEEEAGDLPGAIGAMQRLVSARVPRADEGAPEIEEVLADAYARLGELELKRGGLDAASKAVEQGLSHAPQPTYFRGHLVEVQGLVMEATAGELADAGRPEEAARAREKAIELLEEVVKIQDQVIRRSLGGGDGERGKSR